MNIEVTDLADAIKNLTTPQIPVNVDAWSSKEIAAFLKVSQAHFRERIAPRPDFPKPMRLPSEGKGKGHPRWKAREVIKWFEGKF